MPGPPPVRDAERRRFNEPTGGPAETVKLEALDYEPPVAHEKWHPVAKLWWESVLQSGMVQFYEPTDWTTAYVFAETISRELQPQFVGLDAEGGVVMERRPIAAGTLQAMLKLSAVMGFTEGDRRRLRIEIDRGGVPTGEEQTVQTTKDRKRLRLAQ